MSDWPVILLSCCIIIMLTSRDMTALNLISISTITLAVFFRILKIFRLRVGYFSFLEGYSRCAEEGGVMQEGGDMPFSTGFRFQK